MKNVIRVQAKLVWKWGRGRSGRYVAICDAIRQTVEADRFEDLLETMHEALDSTFRELLASGDLDNFLREHGWGSLKIPSSTKRRNVRFDVPFDVRGIRTRDLEEALC
jgi:Arc/MetJ-type ribon-helix-helix transcriptional regulator